MRSSKKRIISASATRLQARRFTFTRSWVKSWAGDVPVSSTRSGYIPGTHRLGFDSAADQITLTHTARSREGFAAGALMAARWIVGRTGVYEFSEVFDDIVKSSLR